MADLSLLQRIERGREAQGLLDHPLMLEAFDGVEAGIFRQWKTAEDPVSRETLWAGFHGARRVETWLRALVDDGKMAKQEADAQNRDGA